MWILHTTAFWHNCVRIWPFKHNKTRKRSVSAIPCLESSFQCAHFGCMSVSASSRFSSFSLLIALNNFIKHHARPKFTMACCLREALSECVLHVCVCTRVVFLMLTALNNSIKYIPKCSCTYPYHSKVYITFKKYHVTHIPLNTLEYTT